MHELGADGGAVEAAGFGDEFVVEVELGDRERAGGTGRGDRVRLEIAPAAEGVERLAAQFGGRQRRIADSRGVVVMTCV